MFVSNIVFHLIALCFLNSYHGLEQLPKDIAPTDEIRDVVNQIFSSLKLKRKQDSKLSEYSTIHKHFVGLTRLENDNWQRVTKLTTIDSKIDNGTTDLTTIINDVLNEEYNTAETNGTLNDDDVNEYIENFLSTLARLKDTYLVNDSYSTINTDVLEHFYRNSISQNNYTELNDFNSNESNSTEELEFWSPTETRRIYRGIRTKIKYFPFLASIHLFNQFTCAGSIIEDSLVITAASCLQLAYNNRFFRENPAFLAVRIGSPFYNAGGERIPVLEVYFHPTYSPRTLKDNIAIMRLERIIKFRRSKRSVKKIQIDRNDWNLPINTKGITIAGWGAKTTGNQIIDPWSNKVSMAVLPIYPLEECQEIYSRDYVGRKNFCAGFMSKGGGACNRDVGAPGVVHGTLTGIASFGSPTCGTVDAPTVFTKVGYYYDWIETIMEQKVPRIKLRTTVQPYFIAKEVIPFEVQDDKQFKIDPISVKQMKKVIDIRNINKLRMDENADFESFLGTMFNGKDQKDNKADSSNVKIQQTKDNKEIMVERQNAQEASKNNEQLLNTTNAEDAEESFEPAKFVTTMDTFEPEPRKSRETDIDENMNLSELEKIAQIEVDDDVTTETRGRTTPILEEYGLSIELSDNETTKNQPDDSNDDSERKHQMHKPDVSENYINNNVKLKQDSRNQVQEVNESKKPEKDGYFENVDATHQLNVKRQDQLRELQEFINEDSENTQFDNEMNIQVEDPKVNLKNDLNTQKKQLRQSVALSGAYGKLDEKRPHQVKAQKESIKYLNHNKKFNNQPKLHLESKESKKYKKEENHQHQEEESQISDDQKDKSDILKKNTFKIKTQLNVGRQRHEKESNHQDVPITLVNANIQTNKLHHNQALEQDKFGENAMRKESEEHVVEQYTTNVNHELNTRWQKKKQDKFMKDSVYQEEGLSIFERIENTEPKKLHHNKRDESFLEIDATPFINERENHVNEQDTFERNARPKFNSKQLHGIEEQEKFVHYIDGSESKHHVGEDKDNQFNVSRENQVQILEESKNENFDKKLDEQIDQLLKNLDVEDKLGSETIEHVNDKKVIEDTKLLEIMEGKQDGEKELADDTLLTFLLLTDNDRNKSETIKPNEENDEDTELNGKEGMTIDGEFYEDLAHRTNVSDDSYKIMSKSEMYDILADVVGADEAVNN